MNLKGGQGKEQEEQEERKGKEKMMQLHFNEKFFKTTIKEEMTIATRQRNMKIILKGSYY